MKVKLLLAFVGALLVAALPLPAHAVDYPVSQLASTTAGPGATVPFSAITGVPNATASISLSGDNADTGSIASTISNTTSTNAAGIASFAVVLPASAVAGAVYSVNLSIGAYTSTATVTVINTNVQFPTLSLPGDSGNNGSIQLPTFALGATGVDTSRYIIFGGALLAIGAVLIWLQMLIRRSRKPQEN